MNIKTFSSCILFLGIVLLGSFSLRADIIVYPGPFVGDTVEYLMVTEASAEVGPLYGAPEVNGDSLDFFFPSFQAQSVDGTSDLVNGELSFFVEAQDGFLINSISISEFGSYTGLGDNSMSLANGIVFVETVDGLFIDQFDFSSTGSDVDTWFGDVAVNFPGVESVFVTFTNVLRTLADSPGSASIDKKRIGITAGTVPAIPEPASGMLLGVICVGLVTRRRRS